MFARERDERGALRCSSLFCRGKLRPAASRIRCRILVDEWVICRKVISDLSACDATRRASPAGSGYTRIVRTGKSADALTGRNFLRVGVRGFGKNFRESLALPAKMILEVDGVFDEKRLEFLRSVNAFFNQQSIHGVDCCSEGFVPAHEIERFLEGHRSLSP